MLDKLRTPFFIIALIALLLAVLIESGSAAWLPSQTGNYDLPTPGRGIPYLALLDGLVLFTLILMALPLVVPPRLHGRIQGIATLIVSLVVLVVSITLIFIAIGLLIMMVSLLFAVPFGTLAYLGAFGHFPVGAAQATLGAVMSLKLACVVLLILAQQRFIENKGLVLILLTSLLANIIISFAHNFARPLVSITDDIAAIVVGILAAIWALVLLIGSIPAITKALRVDRALTG